MWRLILTAVLLLAAAPAASPQGLMPEWEVKQALAALTTQTQRLKPILDEFKPQDWTRQGAPQTYVAQLKSAQDEIGFLVRTAETLAKQPDKLTLTLEVFLRLEAMETMVDSLGQGARRYQNPALADLLQGVVSETAGSREKLRQYLVELATAKEDELRIANLEAQRCRSTLIRKQPAKTQAKPERQ